MAALCACRAGTHTPDRATPTADAAGDAQRILAGSRRALGAVGRIRTIETVAAVTGPRSSFVTHTYSARDGRVRAAIGAQFLAGVGARESWLLDPSTDTLVPLDPVSRSLLRGHELHMLVLAPETRWRRPRASPASSWQGQPALAVEFDDDLGGPVTLYLSPADTMPVGLLLVNHTGQGLRDVEVTFDRWELMDSVRLFRQAVFAQKADRFVYDYTDIRLNAVPDSMFEPPRKR